MDLKLKWSLKTFDELTNHELYEILRLRNEVFVLEQHCVFLDQDNKDQQCHHLAGTDNGQLMAYARIVPANLSYEFPSIGRVVVSPLGRGKMYGVALMKKSIESIEALYGQQTIRIGAQFYLKKFYASFGFKQSSEIYDEDGIDHIEMTREPVLGNNEC
ncbi:GNAT family N-acetyltransferase [Dyadobacter sp. LHD-138]|uniref:GNAT family N-acetyltransferase n=1 Tax=Dyadobacter sp. LHD-138 TaxID=3071413 RepID=UPI0027DFB96B|nr:GNAT family N-acetyltransferase [Dyadobacter sp. LHD-138]MDQ6477398.1 GNAT family N-acetyltransferase [Dyadobacter sp. LHD-138]